MKKIDFHIHTVCTASDAPFTYNQDNLIEYVERASLDAIAITNHNVFNLPQFHAICKSLKIPVLPGIEVDLEGGHIIVLSSQDDLADFDMRCAEISRKITPASSTITIAEFKEIFHDLSKYLLIPHYDKTPNIPSAILAELSDHILAGEVQSPKKFIYCLKDKQKLTPLYFSDCRISPSLSPIPSRQTFLNCGEITINALKSCLKDKAKVSLSENEGSSLFQILDTGLKISTGLTVIIGERSSGKTHTLKQIFENSENAKLIEQFELVARNEEEDKTRFDTIISKRHSLFAQEYLREFQNVINEMTQIDVTEYERKVAEYLDTLIKYASESEREDAFSKATLFREQEFQIKDLKGLKELIDSVRHLIENIEYRQIIDKHIDTQSLKNLIVELMTQFSRQQELNLKMEWANNIIANVKQLLILRTSATPPKDVNFYDVAMGYEKRKKFNELVGVMRKPRRIMENDQQGFKLVAEIGEFGGAGELKKQSKTQLAFRDAFSSYKNPYDFLQSLKAMGGLAPAIYHELFASIQYKIKNREGADVSGGERSEFFLLQAISNAQQYDLLLIDEPESSFDNIFLKNEVNRLVKEISRIMPVVLVTHNNTIGASINPDYIIHTKKEVGSAGVEYFVYTGFPTDKTLVSDAGKEITNYDATMNCLEAGSVAYTERRKMYENLAG